MFLKNRVLVHRLVYQVEGSIMKKLIFFSALYLLIAVAGLGQTCTVTGTSPLNWPTNGSGIVCSGGGNAVGKTTLVIPAGFTVNFNDNGDTWSGTTIEIYGTVNVTANPTINASIIVKNGGLLNLTGKLSLGSGNGCPYTLVIAAGGRVTLGGTGSDRLSICGDDIFKGNGGCNSCGGTNSGQCPSNGQPYCQPAGGFTGPSGYDEGGFDATLPVKLSSFNVEAEGEQVRLTWTTIMERDFLKFVIQHSQDGTAFEDIGEVVGQGFNIDNIESKYTFEDVAPFQGWNYYRLKAIDVDNSYEYFSVRAIRFNGAKKLTAYPNPVEGRAIGFRVNFSPQESDRIIIIDQVGIELYNAPAITVDNTISLPESLPPGVYMLRYVSQDFEKVTRVIVK